MDETAATSLSLSSSATTETSLSLKARLREIGIVPVVALERAECALPLADALIAGGLPVVEVTFRTAAAAAILRTLRRERPQLLVGAGTVVTAENLHAALEAGAQFCVAPGFHRSIVESCRQQGVPFVPGIATPSEIEAAFDCGARLMKFFPAGALGGAEMLEAIAAPYAHLGIEFMPTGGVNPANLASYLSLKSVVAVGGTWLLKKEDAESGNWDAVRVRCLEARAIAAAAGRKPTSLTSLSS